MLLPALNAHYRSSCFKYVYAPFFDHRRLHRLLVFTTNRARSTAPKCHEMPRLHFVASCLRLQRVQNEGVRITSEAFCACIGNPKGSPCPECHRKTLLFIYPDFRPKAQCSAAEWSQERDNYPPLHPAAFPVALPADSPPSDRPNLEPAHLPYSAPLPGYGANSSCMTCHHSAEMSVRS